MKKLLVVLLMAIAVAGMTTVTSLAFVPEAQAFSIKKAAKKVGRAVKKNRNVGRVSKVVGKAAGRGAKKAGKVVKRVARVNGKAVVRGATKAGKAVKRVARGNGKAVVRVAKKAGKSV